MVCEGRAPLRIDQRWCAHNPQSRKRKKCHPSAILRQTRKIERLADTKAVQQALHRLRTNKDEMPQYSSALGMCSATAELQKLLHLSLIHI